MTADLSDNLFTQSINKRVLFAKTKGNETKLPFLVAGTSGQSLAWVLMKLNKRVAITLNLHYTTFKTWFWIFQNANILEL